MNVERRTWLRAFAGTGLGAAVGAVFGATFGADLGAWWSHASGEPAGDAPPSPSGAPQRAGQRAGHGYGHGAEPPAGVTLASRRAFLEPPPPGPPAARTWALHVAEQPVAISSAFTTAALTYDGAIPGPILRCTEGDAVTVRLRNLGTVPHTVHFHGRHDAQADGWEPVPPGDEATYRFTAAPFGVHPYHCHVGDADDHAAAGMHGVLIVDPREPRPPAHEVVLVLSGHGQASDGRAAVYAWNGVAGLYAREPIRVPAGALVRAYVVNACLTDPAASVHLHAATFDVFRTGTRRTPDEHTDVVTLGPMERAILEFRLPRRGRYMFHPHQPWMARRGAMGWFAAT